MNGRRDRKKYQVTTQWTIEHTVEVEANTIYLAKAIALDARKPRIEDDEWTFQVDPGKCEAVKIEVPDEG